MRVNLETTHPDLCHPLRLAATSLRFTRHELILRYVVGGHGDQQALRLPSLQASLKYSLETLGSEGYHHAPACPKNRTAVWNVSEQEGSLSLSCLVSFIAKIQSYRPTSTAPDGTSPADGSDGATDTGNSTVNVAP